MRIAGWVLLTVLVVGFLGGTSWIMYREDGSWRMPVFVWGGTFLLTGLLLLALWMVGLR